MLNFCIVSGSARAENNTFRVALALHHKLQSLGYQTSLVDFRAYDIPLINQGEITPDNYSPFQQKLTDGMHLANCIVIITPEYNWSTTPEILNWLHRFGDKRFKHLFENKVFATVGVSTGKGGKAPALHLHSILNKIISFTDLDSIVSAKIFESHFTKDALDVEGLSLNNTLYDNGLEDFIRYTARITNRWIGFKAS